MPLEQEEFDDRIEQIQRKILPKWPEAQAYLVFQFPSHSFSGILMLLKRLDWESAVEYSKLAGKGGGTGSAHWNAAENLEKLTLRVRLLETRDLAA